MWQVIETEGQVHVVPDFGKHELEPWCNCGPRLEQDAKLLVIHNVVH